MTRDERRTADEANGRENDHAAEGRDGQVGRMMPIDPGVGPGGTTAPPDHTDVAPGVPDATEWREDVVMTGRADVVDPDAAT